MEVVLTYFFPGDCYDKVVKDFNFFDVDCLSLALARWLSFSILLGAVGVKLPQILKIIRNNSIEGLSYLSFLFELTAFTITSGYNYSKKFAFSTWGEAFFIAIQVFAIVCLMFLIERKLLHMVVFVLVYLGVSYCFIAEIIPMEILQTLQGSTILLMIISKSIQVHTTWRNGSTGQQAFLTNFLNWVGASGRIFTTLKETMDPLILASFSISFSLNTLIVFQFFWYWNVRSTKDSKKRD